MCLSGHPVTTYSPSQSNTEPIWERCPQCSWRFISRVCCDDSSHNVGTVCSRCHAQFLSAAS